MTPRRGTVRPADPCVLNDVHLDGRTLYEHAAELLGPRSRGPIPHGGEPLPDEPPPDPARIRWAGGASDGLMAVRGGRSDDNAPLAAAAAVLDHTRSAATPAGLRSVAEAVAQVSGPQAMDRFVNAVVAGKVGTGGWARGLARWLCMQGVRREQVKAGLALLGVVGCEEDAAVITHLGRLEELTLYAAVALKNLLAEPDKALLDLADQVTGWGRIHCVHRLSQSTDPDVQRWLLHGGYDNGVMVEEIAYIAATTGRLRYALETDQSDALLDHAGALLAALAIGGPAEDMKDYPDGGPALDTYLNRMRLAPASLTRLRHLRTLDGYLSQWSDDNPHLHESDRRRLRSAIADVLARPEWRAVAEEALHGSDLQQVEYAITLVRQYGIDPIPIVRQWLLIFPHDGYLWQTLLLAADDVSEIRRLVSQAREVLPFSAVPVGPSNGLGLGPEYESTRCLELILQRLRDFPGEGEAAIQLGLRSAVVRCRNMALRAVAAWPTASRPDELVRAVQAMAWNDPAAGVKKLARRVDSGLPAEP